MTDAQAEMIAKELVDRMAWAEDGRKRNAVAADFLAELTWQVEIDNLDEWIHDGMPV